MHADSDDIALILSEVKILKDLGDKIIRDIAQHSQIGHFDKNQVIVEAGHSGTRLHFIASGRLEVQIPDDRGAIKQRISLEKGDVVGEISLLFNTTYTADIVALTETVVFYLDQVHFRQLIEKHPAFAEVMSRLMTSRMAQTGGINRVGKYELKGKLGEGNMATVFDAWDPELEREVAIKMLKYNLAYDAKFLDRFEQEAKVIASLNHAHIVNVFEIIDEFSTRFIVMEKLPGQDLAATLRESGAFNLVETREILSQVASALQYAHSQGEHGIVHRDIKPSNIVINHHGHIKLTDFGIAGPPRRKEVNIEGSPSYLAPEIINGQALDGRADIYALGVMAFNMLTNNLPFSANSLAKLLKKQLSQKPPDIRNACPAIDEALAMFIDSALSKQPEQRISDWDQIRKILRPIGAAHNLQLDPDELALVIRFRDDSNRLNERLKTTVQDMLVDAGISHSIEVHHGDDEAE